MLHLFSCKLSHPPTSFLHSYLQWVAAEMTELTTLAIIVGRLMDQN